MVPLSRRFTAPLLSVAALLAGGVGVVSCDRVYESPEEEAQVPRADRWQKSWDGAAARGVEPGFHLPKPNEHLERHQHLLKPGPTLVPLCGKTLDMTYLATKGHDVIGVEIIDDAIQQFFDGKQADVSRDAAGALVMSTKVPCERTGAGKRVAVVKDDFFQWGHRINTQFENVWDRGSFVAIQPVLRPRYVSIIEKVTVEGGRILLVTLEYNAQDMNGPPFSSSEEEIRNLYGGSFEVETLSRDSIFDAESHWKKKGLTAISQAVYLLTRKKGDAIDGVCSKSPS